MSSAFDDLIAELYSGARAVWTARFVFAANIALQIYDYSTTLEQEYRLVWPSKLTLGKVVYILNRYLPFASSIFLMIAFNSVGAEHAAFCRRAEMASAMLCTLQFTAAEYALALRAYAVWGRNVYVTTIIVLGQLAFTAVGYYFAFYFTENTLSILLTLQSPGCVTSGLRSLIPSLASLIASETLSLVLLVAKTIWHARWLSSVTRTGPSLLNTMLRDGVAYFICIIAITIANIMVNTLAVPILHGVFIALQATLQNVLCVRLLLHVRSVSKESSRPEHELTTMFGSNNQGSSAIAYGSSPATSSGSGSRFASEGGYEPKGQVPSDKV